MNLRGVSYPWLSARARNTLRHRMVITVVAGVAFLVVLISLVLIPRQASRAAHIAASHIEARPDTIPVLRSRDQADTALAHANAALTAARHLTANAAPHVPAAVPSDTLSPALRAERDSLNMLLKTLTAAMAHAAEAPLPPAFRALAQAPALQGNAQVRVWLDSVDQVDKLREPFGALGAGDPIYVVLTARLNELGRSIRDAAELKSSELRSRIAPLTVAPIAPPPTLVVAPRVDTVRFIAMRAVATRDYMAAAHMLDSMRIKNARIDAAISQSRELSNVGAPPSAMLAAAFVIALAIGFSATFVGELRHPRVAHTRDAEAMAGARVLTVVRPTTVVERSRRQSDIDAPPLIDIISESYRTLYLHLAAVDASIPIVTVTGDSAAIVATVAANIAAIAAYDGRSTLLIDVDSAIHAVASILRLAPDPGLTGVLSDAVQLPEAIVSTTIGRDRPLDVLPSGTGRLGSAPSGRIDTVRDALSRMEQRYDFLIIAAPTSYVQLTTNTVIPASDVILCARIGDTRLTDLRSTARSLRGSGRSIRGVVLWDEEMPRL